MKSPTVELELPVASDASIATPRATFRPLWRIVKCGLVAYLSVVLGMTFLEKWLVYPVPPSDAGDWHPTGLAYEDVSFTSGDGTKLHGWYLPNPAAKRALLYCH